MNDMSKIEDGTAVTPAGPPPPPERRAGRRRLALMLAVPLLLLLVGGYLWLTGGRTESTDNAYVQHDRLGIATEVGGRIVEVAVHENQSVKAGDLLFRIDPQPYRIALEKAEADLADARIKVTQLRSNLNARTADVGARHADVRLAEETLNRQSHLLKQGFTTRAAYDQAVRALTTAQQDVAVASADAVSARDALGSAGASRHPLVLAALAARDQAALDLQRTTVRAPQAGTVTQADRLQVGQMTMSGLSLLTLVVDGRSWIEANFKETQLEKIRIGQPAEISFDAYPGQRFAAHVTSIGVGTGSEFSLLPAQNATGNWVKVTQRVPVRLRLDRAPPMALAAGLSADVTVIVSDRR